MHQPKHGELQCETSASSHRRRQILLRSAAWACALALPTPFAHAATPAAAPRIGKTLRIVIPANAGGGWDQTGRALGSALVACGSVDEVIYQNIGGKGGTIGLAQYVEQYSVQPDTLMISGMVMLGAIALQKTGIDLSQVQPLARLTSDYVVVATSPNSPYRTAQDLIKAMQTDLPSVTVAGGSAGGVDHMFAGILARTAKAQPAQLTYKPHAGGSDVVSAVLKGEAQIGISGYSEMSEALASGRLKALGVSSRKSMYGIASFRELGIDAQMSNWRGVVTGKNVPAERARQLLAAVEAATATDSWKRSLQANRWDPALQSGRDFSDFLAMEMTTAQVMAYLLKLRN